MRELIEELDRRVDDAFARLRGNALADRVFYTASSLGEFGHLWVMLALVRFLRGGRDDERNYERVAVRALVAIAVESVLVNAGLKSLFGRSRPVVDGIVHPFPFRQPLTSSFPSGHATSAFCAATVLSEQDPLGPLYFAAATVVAASRIHVKIHHASDVLAGAAIGVALGLVVRKVSPLPPAPRKGRTKL
jgi:membrane-associated phospholipid phosphatase